MKTIIKKEGDKVMADFGERIRNYRTSKGITLTDLANKTGISRSYLSRVESGRADPSFVTAFKIVNELKIPFETLFPEAWDNSYWEEVPKPNLDPDGDHKSAQLVRQPFKLGLDYSMFRVEFPHTEECPCWRSHDGTEFLYIENGELEIEIFDSLTNTAIPPKRLKAGQAISFISDFPHRYINKTDEPVRGINVMSDFETLSGTPKHSDVDKNKIGSIIRKCRKEKGWTLDDLAKKSGLTRNFLGYMENNQSVPSFRTVFKLIKELEVPFDTFFQAKKWKDDYVKIVDSLKWISESRHGYRYAELARSSAELKLPFIWRMEFPPAKNEPEWRSHDGGESLYLENGALEIKIKDTYKDDILLDKVLKAEGAISFISDFPHTYWNKTDEPVRGIIVITDEKFIYH